MQRPLSSRKRGAPGADQTLPPPQQPFNDLNLHQPAQDSANAFGNQFMDWGNTDGLSSLNPQFGEQPTFDNSLYDTGLNSSLGIGSGAPIAPAPASISSQLVRRNPNQQLATRGRTWQDSSSTGMPQTQPQGAWEDEDEAELEQRALAAKREAQAKRKQIPPFVQKLSRLVDSPPTVALGWCADLLGSFLDESNNTELIRWSDDGRSFIVLDEDEFAKTLIPELFKHNNYASFVRQLNMYGFHKKVGLSDNSMKASENKRKTPSEYWNKYFRRGRPELLWLIQKPKNPPPAKRKREEGKKEEDSDDERKGAIADARPGSEAPHGLSQDLTVIPKTELASLRNELVTLQRQQKFISGVINQIKRQNDQMYQQANAFQALHDRHESSINAILTFLATFYNRSLEGHGGANIADMFAHAISQNQSHQGNIVDMGDLSGINVGMNQLNQLNQLNQGQTPNRRRQPLLLPAPDAKPAKSPVTLPPSARSTVSPKPRQQPIFRPQNQQQLRPSSSDKNQQSNHVPSPATLKSETESPNYMSDSHDIMSVINAANAATPTSTGPKLDFNSALEHYETAGGNAPLTPQRRNEVLSMMANTTDVNSSSLPITSAPDMDSALNALANSQPPPVPPISQISQTQEQLDLLQRLQEEQAAKVQHLAERLGPLSPSGTVPLLHDAVVNGTTVPPPQEWSLDDWVDPNIDPTNGFDWGAPTYDPNDTIFNNDIDLKFDTADDHGIALDSNGLGIGGTEHDLFGDSPMTQPHSSGGRVESVDSRAASPADAAENKGDVGSPRKRRRTGGQS
jgi:heat shock transcription factor, other eukaryote